MALKTKGKILISLLVSAVAFGIISLFSKVDIDSEGYGFNEWNINATVNEDGSMKVNEELHYYNVTSDKMHVSESLFGFGKANRNNKLSGIGDSSLREDSFRCSVISNGTKLIDNASEPINTTSRYNDNSKTMFGYSWSSVDCYDERGMKISKNGNYDKVFIYLPNGLPDNGLVIKYEYIIDNVVSKYSDYSVINWKFAGAYDQADTKNVKVTVNFPESAKAFGDNISNEKFLDEGITTIGFGSTHAKYTKVSSSQIQCEASTLKYSSGEEIEILTTFNNSICDVFSSIPSSLVSSSNCKDIAKGVINNAFEEENKYYREHNFAEYTICIAGGIAVVSMLALIVYAYLKYDKERKPVFDSEYYRELPGKYGPAAMNYLYTEKEITKDSLNAQIMDLIRKKYITLDTNGCSLTDEKPNYIMIKEDKDDSDLLESEKYLLHWLFDVIAKGNSLSFNDMEKFVRNAKNAEKYNSCNIKWNNIVKKEGEKYPWFDEINKPKTYVALDVIMIVLCFIAFLPIVNYNLSFISIVLVSVIVGLSIFGLMYFPNIMRKSEQGIEEYSKWNAFKHFLTEFSHFEDYPIPSLIVWEEYMVYATAFGIADLVEKQLKMKFKQMNREAEYDAYPFFYYHTYHHICHRMHSNFVVGRQTIAEAKAKQMASSGGRSGGFGGGSSFGGGGRGGSFR